MSEREPFVNAEHLANEVTNILHAYMVHNNFHDVCAVNYSMKDGVPGIKVFVADGRLFEMQVRDTGHKWSPK